MKRAEKERPAVCDPGSPAVFVSPESSRIEAAGEGAPLHEEIARRAYELYLETGCEKGRCLQNWLRAERELVGRGAGEAASSRAVPARVPAGGHSELLNGDRPDVDARLIRDVMGAGADGENGGRSELRAPPFATGEGDRRVALPPAGAERAGGSVHSTAATQ